jgi:hypothetical protein
VTPHKIRLTFDQTKLLIWHQSRRLKRVQSLLRLPQFDQGLCLIFGQKCHDHHVYRDLVLQIVSLIQSAHVQGNALGAQMVATV